MTRFNSLGEREQVSLLEGQSSNFALLQFMEIHFLEIQIYCLKIF